jgi:hypothetical protein
VKANDAGPMSLHCGEETGISKQSDKIEDHGSGRRNQLEYHASPFGWRHAAFEMLCHGKTRGPRRDCFRQIFVDEEFPYAVFFL